jgi:hypothetical protein
MNGAKFLAYVKNCMAPTLKRKDKVVIDNLAAHKAPGIRAAIEARGATLRYLPQYSPDFNPIEMPFSKSVSAQSGGTNNSWFVPPHWQVRLHVKSPRSS